MNCLTLKIAKRVNDLAKEVYLSDSDLENIINQEEREAKHKFPTCPYCGRVEQYLE